MKLLMKTMLLTLLVSAQALHASESISNVTICAAECYSENLNIRGHNEALVGVIHYATATDENRENSNVCLSDSKTIEVISNRLSDESAASCMKALAGEYRGEKVNLIPEKFSEGEEGVYFSIEVLK